MRTILSPSAVTAPRALLVLMLAASVLLHTVLGFLSELHEYAGHAPAAFAQHADGAHPHADDHDQDESGGSGSDLHAILHLVHCCGHGGSAVIDAALARLGEPAHSPRSHRYALTLPASEPSNPFRPPIAV